MHKILLVGADKGLLRTRAAVLGKTGSATIVATPATALSIQAQSGCEVMVLCHTVPDLVGLALTQIFRERWPDTRILQVLPGRDWGSRSAASIADAVSYTDPERLLDRTADLLRRWEAFHDAPSVRMGAYMN